MQRNKFILFFILSVVIVYNSYSQVNIKFDTIKISSGIKLPVTLMINESNVLNLSVINFIDSDGDPDELPIANISKIIKYGGKVIYPKTEEKVALEAPVIPKKKEEPKIVCNSEKANLIKLRINEYVKNRLKIIKANKTGSTTNYRQAKISSNDKLKNELYEELYSAVMKFNCTDASLVSQLEILVDEEGNYLKLNTEVESITKSSFYDDLEDQHIIPFLKNYNYPKETVRFDTEEEYNKLYNLFLEDMKSTNCPLTEFDYALKIAQMDLEGLVDNNLGIKMAYTIPLNYSFENNFQLWKLKNDEISLKKNSDIVLTDPEMKKQFFESIPKKKNGVYEVNVCTSELFEEDMTVSLADIKKRKNKWMKIGAIGIMHPSTDLTVGGDKINLEDQYFFSAHLILNRIGFFYGSKLELPIPIDKKNGIFISDVSQYHEGGMYFGLSNSFFMKIGYQNLSGQLELFDANGIKDISNTNYNKDFSQSGIVAGLAVVFPVFHTEFGYNYVFDSFYVGAGLNIPIKK